MFAKCHILRWSKIWEEFEVQSEDRQSCILSLILFLLFIRCYSCCFVWRTWRSLMGHDIYSQTPPLRWWHLHAAHYLKSGNVLILTPKSNWDCSVLFFLRCYTEVILGKWSLLSLNSSMPSSTLVCDESSAYAAQIQFRIKNKSIRCRIVEKCKCRWGAEAHFNKLVKISIGFKEYLPVNAS